MFNRYGFGQDGGIVFNEVKAEIVLPSVDVAIFCVAEDPIGGAGRGPGGPPNEMRDADYRRRLPDGEIGLLGESGRFEVSIPIHAWGLEGEVGALPRIVLLEDIGGIRIGSEGLRHPDLE